MIRVPSEKHNPWHYERQYNNIPLLQLTCLLHLNASNIFEVQKSLNGYFYAKNDTTHTAISQFKIRGQLRRYF